jgi:glycerol-3-phosphate dehydrogenase
MWTGNWREETWSHLDQAWDIIVIGGGITGAGILREATRLGLRALLLEQRDFAWGTSSRSSKLVHGGLRYLKEGKIGLTRASVHERERLLDDGPGLIDPLGFLLATYRGDNPGRWMYQAGLAVYDLLALQWSHQRYGADDFQKLAPNISQEGLKGGFRYGDAQTDDARLVLRVIREAAASGGTALNYATVETLLRNHRQVYGVQVRDEVSGAVAALSARVVVNATGAWADRLRGQIGAAPRIRPLRGSHLIFSAQRLPLSQAVSFLHPFDRRPVFIFPWEGVTLVGTTDVDHDEALDAEPAITAAEVAYLMAAADAQFPLLHLTLTDVVATYAGVRPVIGSGQADPSKESRDHVVWEEEGLLTVTGGKLTTFRLIALDVLRAVRHRLPALPAANDQQPVLNQVDVELAAVGPEPLRRRLLGRYGADAVALVAAAQPGELEPLPGALTLWAELRWAARAEGVVHLDDLLLRRVRVGLLLPKGGAALLPAIAAICQAELGWDDARWQAEEQAYRALWQRCYSIPAAATIPDWRPRLDMVRMQRQQKMAARQQRRRLTGALISLALSMTAVGLLWALRRQAEARRSHAG